MGCAPCKLALKKKKKPEAIELTFLLPEDRDDFDKKTCRFYCKSSLLCKLMHPKCDGPCKPPDTIEKLEGWNEQLNRYYGFYMNSLSTGNIDRVGFARFIEAGKDIIIQLRHVLDCEQDPLKITILMELLERWFRHLYSVHEHYIFNPNLSLSNRKHRVVKKSVHKPPPSAQENTTVDIELIKELEALEKLQQLSDLEVPTGDPENRNQGGGGGGGQVLSDEV